jgi:hypothetical protein
MTSATESEPTDEPSRDSDQGFLITAVGSLLAVAAVAALVYLSADSPDLDLTGTPRLKECPIHHLPLVVTRAPITYGGSTDWQRDYYRASKISFPHAGTTVFASTQSQFSDHVEETYRFARVMQCPDCVRAEQRWYAATEEPNELPESKPSRLIHSSHE